MVNIEDQDEEFAPISLTQDDFRTFSRAFVGESLRRNIKRDSKAFTKEQILNCLMPRWREEVQKYKQ